MGLNKAKGNMYSFITHTWNPVKGRCGFGCSYCYVRRMCNNRLKIVQREPYFDEKVLRSFSVRHGYVFVCSSTDLFHDDVPSEWIEQIKGLTENNPAFHNRYLWHSKNPERVLEFQARFQEQDILCVTIETNRCYELSKAPHPVKRFNALYRWKKPWMLTIEPILDFDKDDFIALINATGNIPVQINIGADSGGNKLPEPSREKIEELIELLAPHTTIHLKKNLRRILPESRYYGNH